VTWSGCRREAGSRRRWRATTRRRTSGETLASFGTVEILASGDVDAGEVRRRVEERRETLRAEIDRAQGKLGNEGFVANAPGDVVEAEREKLAGYRAELEDLG
jgi:valyl-tRNA synthetase